MPHPIFGTALQVFDFSSVFGGNGLAPAKGMDAQTFYRQIKTRAERPSLDDARRVTAAVFHALRDRLTPEEADHAAAQLPRPLKLVWWCGDVYGRRRLKMHRRAFYARVQREAGLASELEARRATIAVFGELKGLLTLGEAEDVVGQLPGDLKTVWEGA